jgi:hypothetical protein
MVWCGMLTSSLPQEFIRFTFADVCASLGILD